MLPNVGVSPGLGVHSDEGSVAEYSVRAGGAQCSEREGAVLVDARRLHRVDEQPLDDADPLPHELLFLPVQPPHREEEAQEAEGGDDKGSAFRCCRHVFTLSLTLSEANRN